MQLPVQRGPMMLSSLTICLRKRWTYQQHFNFCTKAFLRVDSCFLASLHARLEALSLAPKPSFLHATQTRGSLGHAPASHTGGDFYAKQASQRSQLRGEDLLFLAIGSLLASHFSLVCKYSICIRKLQIVAANVELLAQ